MCRLSHDFFRYFTIVGPRTTQFGKDYKIFITATDYDVDDQIVANITLSGKKFGEDIDNLMLPLKHLSQEKTFHVNRDCKI